MAKPKIDEGHLGLTVGVFAALLHVLWLLAYFALGQSLLDLLVWLYGLHGLSLPITLVAVDITSAVELVVLTFVGGYVVGYAFAFVWNWLTKIR